MWPAPLFQIAGFDVNLYVLLNALGAVLALLLGFYLAHEQGFPLRHVMPVWIICAAAAGFGGMALTSAISSIFNIRLPGIWSLAWLVSLPLVVSLYLALFPWARGKIPQIMDMIYPPIALAMAPGRLGCFSAGCCYGKPAEGLWWAVRFPAGHPTAGVPVHPTQLYEAFGMLVILALLLGLRKAPAFQGALMWVFLAAYGLLRFVIEFYRGDPRPMLGVFSLNQVVCFAFVTVGSGIAWMQVRASVRRSTSAAG